MKQNMITLEDKIETLKKAKSSNLGKRLSNKNNSIVDHEEEEDKKHNLSQERVKLNNKLRKIFPFLLLGSMMGMLLLSVLLGRG